MNERPGSVREEFLAALPSLRAFAISLCGSAERADDLVQETLLKAWSNLGSFAPGTNMRAWLFTILRNAFYSQWRKRRNEVEDADGVLASTLSVKAPQPSHMEMQDFKAALAKIPADQREALILVQASGFSYQEAAEVCNCAVGTVKSRVNRARRKLAEILEMEGHAAVDSSEESAKEAAGA